MERAAAGGKKEEYHARDVTEWRSNACAALKMLQVPDDAGGAATRLASVLRSRRYRCAVATKAGRELRAGPGRPAHRRPAPSELPLAEQQAAAGGLAAKRQSAADRSRKYRRAQAARKRGCEPLAPGKLARRRLGADAAGRAAATP